MDDCRVRAVDEWKGVCVFCERRGQLVLLERGPRWTAREVFGRSFDPRRDFSVHCRTCGSAMPVPPEQLTAAIEESTAHPDAPWEPTGGNDPRPGALPAPRTSMHDAAPAAAASR